MTLEEKAKRISEIRMWYMRVSKPDMDQGVAIGFLLECLEDAERAAGGYRQMCTRIRDSRDVVIADLERQLVAAMEPAAGEEGLEVVEVRAEDGTLRARVAVDPEIAPQVSRALEESLQGDTVGSKRPERPS